MIGAYVSLHQYPFLILCSINCYFPWYFTWFISVGDVGKIRGQRIQEKWVYMLKTKHASTRTFQNYYLILEKDFKMILLGKVSYKGLVLVKNMKPTSLNQNLDNWKWFSNLCQNRGANTAANFQKS